MRNRQRVLVQIYGDYTWRVGRVVSARRQMIRITEGPMTGMILEPATMMAWRRTP